VVSVLKELIECMAKALVDSPEQVKVSEIKGENTSVIELNVAKDDLGKVIGKQGRNAHAMRAILSAAASKVKKRAVLEIVEEWQIFWNLSWTPKTTRSVYLNAVFTEFKKLDQGESSRSFLMLIRNRNIETAFLQPPIINKNRIRHHCFSIAQ
jgi:uncharacterized protein